MGIGCREKGSGNGRRGYEYSGSGALISGGPRVGCFGVGVGTTTRPLRGCRTGPTPTPRTATMASGSGWCGVRLPRGEVPIG